MVSDQDIKCATLPAGTSRVGRRNHQYRLWEEKWMRQKVLYPIKKGSSSLIVLVRADIWIFFCHYHKKTLEMQGNGRKCTKNPVGRHCKILVRD